MGNAESNVTSGIKGQADSSQEIYKLIDVKGGGELITLTKQHMARKITTPELEEKIRELVEPFLYCCGEGKLVPVCDLVMYRNKERPKSKQIPPAKLATHQSANASVPPSLASMKAYSTMSTATLNGSIKSVTEPKYRLLVWDMDKLGAVGETALLLCFLNSSLVHFELARRLIHVFPKMINDYYLCDEYYGESSLHMAIVNEDPAMVKYLLDNGINYNERCCGNFFSPEDQKPSRMDNLDHEWVDVAVRTDYEGWVYWGEYPLSFAACVNQEECYRLLLAKGADPRNQDNNGNTVVHLMVIHENINMFRTVYELGCSMDIKNRQGLTPLTLSAKLAKKDIFFLMCKLNREIYWQLGAITCAAYPLDDIDTINPVTGEINKNSALNLVVYGEKVGHLDMMEGLLIDLLVAKWNSFIKGRFYLRFFVFTTYFFITLIGFVLRPEPPDHYNVTTTSTASDFVNDSVNTISDLDNTTNLTKTYAEAYNHCFLQEINTTADYVRFVFEVITIVGGAMYILEAVAEYWFLGYQTFYENLATAPSRVLFLISCSLMMLMIPLRVTCCIHAENIVAVFVMLLTAPYFLFFCRGFKMVGPFVVMIYKMILTDLLCFVTIYLVFVMGFSQAYFVIHLSHNGERNFFVNPVESFMALFVMSLTEFGDIFKQFDSTEHPYVAKGLFLMYMTLVAVLLINMLIAMMGKTYQDIAERKNEWMRQWARIVLVVERGFPPKECLAQLIKYSQPMADGKRALVVKHHHDTEDKEELEDLEELRANHMDNTRKRLAGSNFLSPKSTPQKTTSSLTL